MWVEIHPVHLDKQYFTHSSVTGSMYLRNVTFHGKCLLWHSELTCISRKRVQTGRTIRDGETQKD